jgi:hypothetical protein
LSSRLPILETYQTSPQKMARSIWIKTFKSVRCPANHTKDRTIAQRALTSTATRKI